MDPTFMKPALETQDFKTEPTNYTTGMFLWKNAYILIIANIICIRILKWHLKFFV